MGAGTFERTIILKKDFESEFPLFQNPSFELLLTENITVIFS